MKLNNLAGALLVALGTLAVAQAGTIGPNGEPPPANPILNLDGTPMPGGRDGTYGQYSVTFDAILTNTSITIALRDDPDFVELANVSLVDLTTGSGNLLTNGGFSGGTYDNGPGTGPYPDGWDYVNIYGATFPGSVTSGCGQYDACWYDGSVGAYDAISQTIATTLGDNYQLSFALTALDDCGECNYSNYGTNVTAYALSGVPLAGDTAPEPSTMLLIGGGLVAAGLGGRRKRR